MGWTGEGLLHHCPAPQVKTEISVESKHQTLQGLAFPLQPEAQRALQQLKQKMINYIQLVGAWSCPGTRRGQCAPPYSCSDTCENGHRTPAPASLSCFTRLWEHTVLLVLPVSCIRYGHRMYMDTLFFFCPLPAHVGAAVSPLPASILHVYPPLGSHWPLSPFLSQTPSAALLTTCFSQTGSFCPID